ncbi:hypothetical protein DH2020_036499 [Rehmannia glutinosa]|uniref:ABC transporter domain-containing protein n=1 Tax=Rehmannia glutinosa TaxID=99300 RepID=A0ABR0V6R9_REHGL
MDARDIHKASSKREDISFRANSSSLWRNTGNQVFSRSSRDEDDEEALKWAALEKLPTFDRLRKGLLFGSKGANEIDVRDLEFQDKKNLVDRLVTTVEEDNEKFLLKLRNRIDRVGIDIPTIEVRYEHLNVDAEAYSASRALPTFVNFNINIIQGILSSLHILPSGKKPFTILKDVSGIIKPCRMTLLLEMLAELSRREKAANIKPDPDVDMYMKVLGLDLCANTLVGDETIRGEMLVGPAKAFSMDEISTGLDSSTTYQIVNMLRQYVHIMKGTAFISPAAANTRDVTSKKDQQQYWAHKDEPYRFISASDFSEAFQSFVVGRRLGDELATPFDKSKSHPAALSTQKYGIAYSDDTYNDDTLPANKDAQRYVRGRRELSMTIYKLPVFYKQRDMFFFPPWAYVIPSWILKIPVTFLEVGIWTFLTYYVIGFDPNAGRLMKQYLLLLLVRQASSALFRFIGAAGRNMIVANTFGLCALLLFFALGGFVLARVDVKKWWLWGYWSSPLMYAQNAILVNEFTGHIDKRNQTGSSCDGISRVFPQAYCFEKPQAVLLEETENDPQRNRSITRVSAQGINESTRRSIEANENRKRGMVLPFEPHFLTFDDIRYSVDMPPELKAQGATEDKLELLKGVSGYFRPGVLTALMGVSGAGKTTLMDVLAGRKTGGYIEGNITISGYPKNQATFARISGYCEQNDIHSPNVTVYESLVYSAWLRLPQEVNAETRKIFIGEVMELVELNSLRGALVGLPGVNGLSTEQRKRLTIAVELVANPSIIFMDEPTSGLDARAAAIVMRTVRNTVDTGRTVVCTIHQPSIDIFEAFDELFLMKRGGQEIYAGPLGRHSSHLIKYFEGIEGVPKIRDGYNPATWMLEVTTSAQELVLGVDFADHYRNSELYTGNKALIKELSVLARAQKTCISLLNTPNLSSPNVLPASGNNTGHTGVIHLTQPNTRQDLFNAMGSMYAAILFLGFQYGSTVQPVVSIERTVFYRERAAGMYSALPYAFSQDLSSHDQHLAEQFGPIMHLKLGEVPTIVVSSPDIAKQILKENDPNFADRPQSVAMEIMWYNYIDIAFSPYGDYWKQMRKICIMELLSAKNVRSFGSIRNDEVSAAFGKVCKDSDALIKLLKEGIQMAGGFEIADLFPSSKIINTLSWSKLRLVMMRRKLDVILDAIINEHKENLANMGRENGDIAKRGNGEFGNEDLVDVFLRIKESGVLEFPIGNDNIKAVIYDMFSAGTETSSTAIDWTMAELIRNPIVMAKAQAEVRGIFKGNKIIEESDVQKLKYLKLIIKETLRLHPPVPILPRASREEREINGYTIPAKVKVLVNNWGMQRDPKYWTNPENFEPERFENQALDFVGGDFQYLPFGTGRRMCPGMTFGLASVELPLAQLLYSFNWKLPDGVKVEDLDMIENPGITASRKDNLFVVATPYESN